MISLLRIDDRLIHAQVVVGWIEFLRCVRVVVVDDGVAEDADRIELFRTVIPAEIGLDVFSVKEFTGRWDDLTKSKESVLALFAGVQQLAAAVDLGIRPKEVNLGGLHEGPGRKLWQHGLYASPDELAAIRKMMGMGIDFEIRLVPASRRREVEGLS